ncbi:hypothetical protein FNV43_RR22635 [Rhamnella rubrinervis]|uniref:BHLH domain-containing protein n=1 Tax=Rhamnella rubrinervis TaxID=2594499 RepID=A0A8K0DRX0_9ROSA|nr:hypothetical protein FNV43_RR22635 [Rhamnella rubrinervis]
MELVGAISVGEWSPLSGIYTTKETDFMAHELFAQFSEPNEPNRVSNLGLSSTFWPGQESTNQLAGINIDGLHYSSEVANSYLFSFPQGSSQSGRGSSNLFPASSIDNFCLSEFQPILLTNNNSSPDFSSGDYENACSLFLTEGDEAFHQEARNNNAEEYGRNHPETLIAETNLQLKWEAEMTTPNSAMENESLPGSSKKRCRSPIEVQKNKKNVKSRKSKIRVLTSDDEDDGSCRSGDNSNTNQDLRGVTSSSSPKGTAALDLNGKARATRGSATDPQSIYARKRREKINERLRILQNLVPNGTKVDISTMLEEAVQYVKFLQLQIKLLSSDDLWMYAPIAYNGMDIGFDLRLYNST